MLLMSCGTPCEESVPSFSKIIPGCCQKQNVKHVSGNISNLRDEAPQNHHTIKDIS